METRHSTTSKALFIWTSSGHLSSIVIIILDWWCHWKGDDSMKCSSGAWIGSLANDHNEATSRFVVPHLPMSFWYACNCNRFSILHTECIKNTDACVRSHLTNWVYIPVRIPLHFSLLINSLNRRYHLFSHRFSWLHLWPMTNRQQKSLRLVKHFSAQDKERASSEGPPAFHPRRRTFPHSAQARAQSTTGTMRQNAVQRPDIRPKYPHPSRSLDPQTIATVCKCVVTKLIYYRVRESYKNTL